MNSSGKMTKQQCQIPKSILINLVGGFNHLEKYESQWERLSHILWKIKNVPNHQPVMLF